MQLVSVSLGLEHGFVWYQSLTLNYGKKQALTPEKGKWSGVGRVKITLSSGNVNLELHM